MKVHYIFRISSLFHFIDFNFFSLIFFKNRVFHDIDLDELLIFESNWYNWVLFHMYIWRNDILCNHLPFGIPVLLAYVNLLYLCSKNASLYLKCTNLILIIYGCLCFWFLMYSIYHLLQYPFRTMSPEVDRHLSAHIFKFSG